MCTFNTISVFAAMNCSSNLLSLLNNLSSFQWPRIPAFLGEALEEWEMGQSFRIKMGTLAVLFKRARSQLLWNPPPQRGWGEPFQETVGTHLFLSWHQNGFLQGSKGLAFCTRYLNQGAFKRSFSSFPVTQPEAGGKNSYSSFPWTRQKTAPKAAQRSPSFGLHINFELTAAGEKMTSNNCSRKVSCLLWCSVLSI